LVLIVIALIVVLIVALGVYLSWSNNLWQQANACAPINGFICDHVVYNHVTGNITFRLAQVTGVNWSAVNISFSPESGATTNIQLGALESGQYQNVTLPATGPVISGHWLVGEIYVVYNVSNGAGTIPTRKGTQIGDIAIKAT